MFTLGIPAPPLQSPSTRCISILIKTPHDRSLMINRREFTVDHEYQYDHRSPLRWLASHIWRYPALIISFFVTTLAMVGSQSLSAVAVGQAFDTVVRDGGVPALTTAALLVVAAYVGYGLF